MPVTPGAAQKLNTLVGISTVAYVTAEEMTNLATKVFPKGLLIVNANGQTLRADGVTTLAELPVVIDQVLTTYEKTALNNTFSGENNAYAPTEGGFLVLGQNGRMASNQLPVNVWDSTNNKIELDALPDTVRAGIAYFATYTAMMTNASAENKRGICLVINASDDPSGNTTAGAAAYAWVDDPDNPGTKIPMKYAEVESLDIDVDSLRPTYEHVQAAGAVMYDHTVLLQAPTLSEVVTKMEYVASESGSGESGESGNTEPTEP